MEIISFEDGRNEMCALIPVAGTWRLVSWVCLSCYLRRFGRFVEEGLVALVTCTLLELMVQFRGLFGISYYGVFGISDCLTSFLPYTSMSFLHFY